MIKKNATLESLLLRYLFCLVIECVGWYPGFFASSGNENDRDGFYLGREESTRLVVLKSIELEGKRLMSNKECLLTRKPRTC